jgi:hypothetical protein
MKYLIYLSPAERQLWARDGQGWQRASGEPGKGPVWVVTDLAEESFAEIKTPRLFGRDRSAFVDRQLATRYPDTPYRGFMTPSQDGDLIGKFAPTRHILFGIDAAERLDAELDATSNPVAGVWPVSMLLALLGAAHELPADLFIVVPGADTLRIVFLKNRTPVLTRLTLTPNRASAQVDEIVRTLRHLENTQIMKRDRQIHPVLLLGDAQGFEAPMAAANLTLVSLAGWEQKQPDDWHFPLFDLALESPGGQVAPLARRKEFIAARLSKAARIAAACILFVGIAAASNNLLTLFGMIQESHTLDASIQQVNARIAEVEASISKFGVAPDIVRRAVALNNDEIASVPAMDQHLRLIANTLASDPNLRIKDLQWRLLAPGVLPCNAPDPTATDAASPQPGSEKRKVEISFDLAVPVSYGPRDRAQTLRLVSSELARIEGVALWQDATVDLASGSLRGGSVLGAVAKLSWCLTLPGVASVADSPKGASRP